MKFTIVIKKRHKLKISSFTLIEVIIFLFFTSVVFLSILNQIDSSLKSNINMKNKISALYLGEQLKEWLMGEKEEDWNNLYQRAGNGYCFNTNELIWSSSGFCQENDYSLLGLFKRELKITTITNDRLNYQIKVNWKEGSFIQSIELNGSFSKFEN